MAEFIEIIVKVVANVYLVIYIFAWDTVAKNKIKIYRALIEIKKHAGFFFFSIGSDKPRRMYK